MTSGIDLPLEYAAVLCGLFAFLGAWLGHWRTARRLDPRRNVVRNMLKPENLGPAIDLAVQRDARRRSSQAVLHGRIDQLGDDRPDLNASTRDEVREHIAAVMRVGLRRDDRVTVAEGPLAGEGFTIVVPGADERAGVHIANRLRRRLGELHLPQMGDGVRLTASFGVAAGRFGQSGEGLGRSARRALDAALERGADHVVPASEIEEILLLPAPAPSPIASAA